MPRADVANEYLVRATLQLKKFEPDRLSWMEYAPKEPTTPSEWFSEKFPSQAKIFGCPFLEAVQPMGDGFNQVTPVSMNTDFFAGVIGGDPKLGHKVVYIEGECAFYYRDPRDGIFRHVSEDKLGNLMRGYFVRCAEELPNNVHKLSLFADYRSDKTIRAIVHRSKSILSCSDEFFGPDSNNQRQQQGPDIYERVARSFVEQVLERQAGEVLTLNDAYAHFCNYLKHKNLQPVKRKVFKELIPPAIEQQYELGIRNDLRDETNKWHCGWKGIHALELN